MVTALLFVESVNTRSTVASVPPLFAELAVIWEAEALTLVKAFPPAATEDTSPRFEPLIVIVLPLVVASA
tara:strand:- start:345 stop:554 length:210 start_codon:yes stop_codon:yes gene_type:complete